MLLLSLYAFVFLPSHRCPACCNFLFIDAEAVQKVSSLALFLSNFCKKHAAPPVFHCDVPRVLQSSFTCKAG
jgi:hypothetical protein